MEFFTSIPNLVSKWPQRVEKGQTNQKTFFALVPLPYFGDILLCHLSQSIPSLGEPPWLSSEQNAGASVWREGSLGNSLPLHWLRTASVATTSGLTIRSAGIEPDSLGIAGCTTHLACWPEPRLAGDCWGNWTNGCYRGLPLC